MSTAKSFARSISGTGRFLQRQVWLWPILAAVVLAGVGWYLRGAVETAMKESLAENLNSIRIAEVAALELWLINQEDAADAIAGDPDVEELIEDLTALADDEEVDNKALAAEPGQRELLVAMTPWMEAHNYPGYAVVNREGRIVASNHTEMIGRYDVPIPEGLIEKIFDGKTTVTPPFKSALLMRDKDGVMKPELPTMFVVAPVVDDDEEVIALLGMRIRPEDQFTQILQIARPGETGETYAFNRDGVMVSNSRFDGQLKQIRLLPEDKNSILNIQLRDPQVNMQRGEQPKLLTSEQPLTRMAADAIDGTVGYDVEGYRDYRGVPVIGSWQWLKKYDFGVATEINVAEAYRPLYILRRTFLALLGILVLCSLGLLLYAFFNARSQREARRAALQAQELGQYKLEEKLGAGGMGVVYRGHHAMLRRPTAVKLLDPEKTTDAAAARFEREVQATAVLNHPNTIAIFDYGRTPEGVFYYAMELLDGLELDELVERHGPQPAGRVVKLLRQVCASLAEAHAAGLIHRDIKPGNIVLNRRGGVPDFVKVLDFGLVKAIDGKRQQTLTAAGSFTGTPLYISPEGIEAPTQADARSDLYAVGAVGYYLLTGKPLFDSENVVEVVMHQVNTVPPTPSQRAGREVDKELEAIIMRCLAKRPADRPQTAKELENELAACQCVQAWTEADAHAWWNEHGAKVGGNAGNDKAGPAQDTDQLAATLVSDQ